MKRFLLLMLLELLVPVAVVAQSLVMDNYVPSDPQVWSFIKYGGQTPDLYTGTVRAEIPIYTYKDPDFEIPIALSYASNGYMPNIQANFVGLGWTLIAGGAITRKVNGIKDEQAIEVFSSPSPNHITSVSLKGYYQYSLQNPGGNMNYPSITDVSPFSYLVNSEYYETEPDFFFFSVPGHKGKFLFKESGGEAAIFDTTRPSGEYKLDFTTFNISDHCSEIKLMTGDGYIYLFEGANQRGTGMHTLRRDDCSPSASAELYDGKNDNWVLSKIIAPNGRQVVYNYESDGDSIVDENCFPFYTYRKESRVTIDNGTLGFCNLGYSSYGGAEEQSYGRIFRTIPTVRLASIVVLDKDGETEACRIEMSYGSRLNEKYVVINGLIENLKNKGRLNSITVKDQDSTQLLKCDLSYRYTGTTSNPGNQVLLLKEVQITGIGKYMMTYVNQDIAFPYHGCISLDHWGYWNNFTPDYSAQNLIPDTATDPVVNVETINNDNRDPNGMVAVSGMLNQITYPTGGKTTFEYEPHRYCRKIIKDGTPMSKGLPIVQAVFSGQEAGGIRVKRITDHVGTKTRTVEYDYSDANGDGSGILYRWPRYRYTFHFAFNYPDTNETCGDWISADLPAYSLEDSYIGYSRVTQLFNDSSKTITAYYDYQDIPDDTQYELIAYIPGYENAGGGMAFSTPYYIHRFLRYPQSLSRCRGIIKQREQYNSDGQLADKVTWQYSLSQAKSAVVKCVKADIDSFYVYHHFVGDYPLTTETRTVYSSSGAQPVVTTTSYTYNNLGQLKRRTVETADGAAYNEDYLYVKDLTGRSAAQDTMVSRNILSPVVYRTLSLTQPGIIGARLIEGTRQLHSLYLVAGRQLPVVTGVSTAVVSSTAQYTSPYSLTWKPKTTVTDVDIYGRPMEIKDANGIYTTWFWGYGGLYPVARIENCRISQISALTHSPFSRFCYGWSGMDDNSANTFRTIPGVSLTHWKYKPHVGVTETTDPSGRKTTFTYNSHGHLTGVIGPDGNKMAEYEYSVDQ